MEDLVGQCKPEQQRMLYQIVLKYDTAFAEKASRVYRFAATGLAREQLTAMGRQFRQELQMDRAAVEIGQPGKIIT